VIIVSKARPPQTENVCCGAGKGQNSFFHPANENEDEADPDLMCLICTSFPYNPVVCNGCKFKACFKCFDEHKLLNKDEKCILCKEKVPDKNINFNNLRENLLVFCGNDFCLSPQKKIIFKHYEDHLISCLKK
jgi:hypothetical protein